MTKHRSLLVLGSALLLLYGCSDDAPATAQKKQKKKAEAKMEAPVIEAPVEDLAYHYDPTDKRDPFRSFINDGRREEGEEGPLERFDITQLRLSAIVWDVDNPKAVIRDPAGRGYIVREGTVVGKNKGRIVTIKDNLVQVKETYVNALGQATTKAVEMRLREGQGG